VQSFASDSFATVIVQVTGTFVGTIAFEESFDGGTTWVAAAVHIIGTGSNSASVTAPCIGVRNVAGATNIRARATAFASGSANVSFVGSQKAASVYLAGAINKASSALLALTNATTAYAAGNIVGGMLTFANVLDASGTGVLQSALVKASGNQTTGYTLSLFAAALSGGTYADKGAPVLSAGDVSNFLGAWSLPIVMQPFGTSYTFNQLDGIGALVRSNSPNLYGLLTCVGTPTFGTTSAVSVEARFMKD
jgi:hypothetical protein